MEAGRLPRSMLLDFSFFQLFKKPQQLFLFLFCFAMLLH